LGILLAAVRERLGASGLITGYRFEALKKNTASGVVASFRDRSSGEIVEHAGTCLIGADGIQSQTRLALNPRERPARWSGYTLWRGATTWPAWEDGRTMLVAGGLKAKFVFYPISRSHESENRLTNWAVWLRMRDRRGARETGHGPESWTRFARRSDLLSIARDRFKIPFIDVEGLIGRTGEVLEFPLLDREPLARWSNGCVTLLGDAAHPMYPVGSNGATQAILDAESLAQCFRRTSRPGAAIFDYERERRAATEALVIANRAGGPERIIDLVEERAPAGFDSLTEMLTSSELRVRSGRLKSTAEPSACAKKRRAGFLPPVELFSRFRP
jgi:2-polyprenyl-6-methoxyphenol hydroxylase-like FAD-dependent oxidoreductase